MQSGSRIPWWRAVGGVVLLAALLAVAARWHGPRAADRDVATTGDAGTVQQLLVTLADEAAVDAAAVDAWSRAVGVPFEGAARVWGAHHVVRLRAPVDAARADQIAARLRQVAGILAADADRRIWPQAVPNDPRFADQWHLYEAAGGINAPDAWDVTTGATDVVVAVLDTGIRPAHPDLAGRLLAGRDFVSSTTFSNDGDGRDADPTDPGNFSAAGECGASSSARVSTWHGTHVAGIIGAATDNGTGVAGIAWQARILPVRTSGKCGGVVSDLIEAIRWSAGLTVVGSPTNPNPAKVINMSLSSPGACPVQLQAAINAARAAGAVLVTGAGNDGVDASSASPANCTGVITVGATTRAGDRAPYSSFGARVDVSAPGGYSSAADSILAPWNDGTTTPGNETYGALQGTSFASAQVAGVAALVRSANSRIDAAKVASVIAATARAFPGGSDCSTSTCGRGIVDAAAAVRAVVTPPVVNAGVDRVVDVGAGVSLEGSATDDGSVASLAWEQTGGPAVALTGATTASPTFTAPSESATLVFRLTATDDVTLTATDSVTISVVRPNRPPSPTAPPLVTDEDTAGNVLVAANDPDGDAVTYSIAGEPSSGTASVDATGRVAYVPPPDYFGTTSVVVEVRDTPGAAALLSIPITVQPVNDVPTAANVSATVAEDGAVVIALAGTDVDGGALTYAVAASPARGTATIVDANAGTVRYVPAADWSGTDEFTYVARDASSASAPARVAITVTAVNDVPVALARTLSATEDQTATASLAATDADGDALTFAIATPPAKGTVTITDAATGAYRYVPAADANGADSFTFVVRDAAAASAPATVTIDIAPVNDAPVATAGTLAATEDVAIESALVATDADGGALAYRIVTPPTRGTVVLLDAATGAYRYTPALNANGADSFTFAARDADVESAPATVSITIAPVDDLPVAQAFALAGDEDVPVADSLRGSDADGDSLTYALGTPPTRGTVVLLDAATGAFRYTPNANAFGGDSFTYTVAAGAARSAPATVSITIAAVNDAPVATGGTYEVDEDAVLSGALVATDADGDALVFEIAAAPTLGTATILDAASGAFRYQPAADRNGSDTFVFSVRDPSGTVVTATARIAVAAVNDAPRATGGTLAVTEDRAATGTLSATDPDGDALVYSVSRAPARGTVVITNAATGAYRYDPTPDANGTDSFEFVARDATLASAPATVSVTIEAVNDAPVATGGTYEVDEDALLTGTLVATDADGDALVFEIATAPTLGTATILDAASGAFRYQPAADRNGSDTFVFRVRDPSGSAVTATARITIAPVNDVPRATGGTLAATEDRAATGTLDAADPDGDALVYSVSRPPARGTVVITNTATGAYRYDPAPDANGTDSFEFVARDATLASAPATVSVTIAAVNDAPVASAASLEVTEDATATGTLSGRDADGDALTYAAGTLPTKGTLTITNAATGAFRYVPNPDATGADTFTFTVADGTGPSAPATVTVTILPVNDPPVAQSLALDVTEDVAADARLGGADADGDPLEFVVATAPRSGTVTITDAATGAFRYVPRRDANGADSFTFVVRDGTATSSPATVTIAIAAVNDAPAAAAGTLAVTEDVAATGTLAAADADGDALSFSIATPPTKGTVTILDRATGAYRYVPSPDANGADSFTFTATDGTAASAPATIAVAIAAANDAPRATGGTLAVTEDRAATGTLAATDPDGDALEYSISRAPVRGTIVITNAATGAYRYEPAADANGADSFEFVARDATLASAPAAVSVTIAAVNDAPVAAGGTLAVTEDVASTGTLAAADADGDALSYTIATPPTKGTITILDRATGAYRYVPSPDANGADSFTFTATDGTVASAPATIAVAIAAVNDAPRATGGTLAVTEDRAATGTLTATDLDGDALVYSVSRAPARGTVVITNTATGAYRYDPAPDANGADSFEFVARDATLASAPATVSVTIAAVNDAPVATAGTLAATEDVTATGTLAATDADGDALSFTIGTAPTKGTVTILDRATGAYRYVPSPDANGADSFTFTASDGTAVSSVETVTVTIAAVNDAPRATAGTLAVTEDRAVTGRLVATDPDGDALEYSISRAPALGTIVITNAATGAYRYEPAPDANGTDSFEFVVRDATLASAPAPVSVTIAAVNDAPVAAAGALAVTEDVAATGTLAAADVDGDALSYTIGTAPTQGTVTILDRATGAYRYVPRPDANGTDSFTFTATDGTAASAPATVAVAIAAVNDAPVAEGLALAVTEDQAAGGTLRGSDADGEALEYVLVGAPAKGRVQLLDAATGRFSYAPNANATGPDAFTYTVRDGTTTAPAATVSITIAAVNDVPVAESGAITVAEDAAFEGTLRARDADGEPLTYAVATAPAKGTLTVLDAAAGTFRYVPRANATGTDAFSFVAGDGTATSAPATITVTIGSTNDPPVALGTTLAAVEDTAVTGRLSGTDSDADALVYEIATPPSLGTVTLVDAAAGTYRYQPNPDANGADAFTFVVRDAVAASAPARVEITIAAVNDAPTAAAQALATDEDGAVTLDLAGADVDGDTLEFTIVTPPARGQVRAEAGAPGRFRYAPDADANGADSFTYRVSDGTTASAPATVTVDVRAVNDPPRLANAAFFVDEDVASTISLSAVDPDGDALQFSVRQAATSGTATVRDAAQGVFLYTPPRNGVGTDRFVVSVADAAGATAVAEITVTIRPANDAPVAANVSATLAEDSTVTVRLAAQDPDGDAVAFAIATGPRHGQAQLLDAATGEVRYVPAPNFHGTDSFTFVARDGNAASAAATVTIEVRPVDDPPVFGAFGLTTVEGTVVALRLPTTDADGEQLTWRVLRAPVRGTATVNGGDLAYAPVGDANGPDEFVLRASDGRTDSPDVLVSVVIAPVNDAPLALAGTLSTREGAAATGSLLGSDADGDALRFLVVRAPDNGRVEIVDESTGAYRYVPNAGFSGRDTFDFAVFDGLAQSARATVAITVEAVTPPPPPPPPPAAATSSGGGGAFGWAAVLALLCLLVARTSRRRSAAGA